MFKSIIINSTAIQRYTLSLTLQNGYFNVINTKYLKNIGYRNHPSFKPLAAMQGAFCLPKILNKNISQYRLSVKKIPDYSGIKALSALVVNTMMFVRYAAAIIISKNVLKLILALASVPLTPNARDFDVCIDYKYNDLGNPFNP
jgi:hypothetical protein